MKPIPLELQLLVYAFAGLMAYRKWRCWLRGAGWSSREKHLALALPFGISLGVAALDAFFNHRLGLPQF
jgi:hypothetical protein